MPRKFYVAYGSNLNVKQMEIRCPNAKIVGISEIPDYQLLFKGSKTGSYLTIEAKKGSVVPVAIWSVTPSDDLALDRYEGFPQFYYKKEIKLSVRCKRDDAEKILDTFVYIMRENRPIGLPSNFYVSTCLRGYQAFGFDEKFLKKAINVSKERLNERSHKRA